MNTKSGGALILPRSNARVLDLCMAPGGYSASVLKYNPDAVKYHPDALVCAYSLHPDMGGYRKRFHNHKSVHMLWGDITTLHKEFGVEEIPHDFRELLDVDNRRPWYGKWFDLIICDGRAHRRHKIADYRRQVESTRLEISQLILAMQRIKSGGTLILFLCNSAAYTSIKTLHLFDKIARIQLFKSTLTQTTRGSFYLIAKNVQPDHPEAVAAVKEWKRVWKELTFPTLDEKGRAKPPKAATESERAGQASDLLKAFGERIIELGEPLWRIQKGALATAERTKKERRIQKGALATAEWTKKEWRSEQRRTGESSSTATDNAAVAVPDSDEDADGSGDEDDDDVDAGPVLGNDSEPDSAELAEVSVAVGRMGVDD